MNLRLQKNIIILFVLLNACGLGGKKESRSESSKKQIALPKECPPKYIATLHTTKGDIEIEVNSEDAPLGAARFYELVKAGYYTDVAFFRVIDGFMAQAGIHGDPRVNTQWRGKQIKDDEVKKSNVKGAVSFATSGPNSRTTQFFINYSNNLQLDGMGFAPFGTINDLTVAKSLYSGYGEGAPRGKGPSQALFQSQGNAYLNEEFPELDYIKSASIRISE